MRLVFGGGSLGLVLWIGFFGLVSLIFEGFSFGFPWLFLVFVGLLLFSPPLSLDMFLENVFFNVSLSVLVFSSEEKFGRAAWWLPRPQEVVKPEVYSAGKWLSG